MPTPKSNQIKSVNLNEPLFERLEKEEKAMNLLQTPRTFEDALALAENYRRGEIEQLRLENNQLREELERCKELVRKARNQLEATEIRRGNAARGYIEVSEHLTAIKASHGELLKIVIKYHDEDQIPEDKIADICEIINEAERIRQL